MTLAVPEEILLQTTQCSQDMACQKPDWDPCGHTVRRVNGSLEVTVEDSNRRLCSYHVEYGGRHFCTCPTRIEIHERYRV